MKVFTAIISMLLSFGCIAQGDSTQLKLKTPAPNQIVVSKENLTFYTTSLTPSLIENEISGLESKECTAVKQRDGVTLHRLWARDFSLDKKQDEIVTSSNALPHYLSLARVIEKITSLNSDMVCTSGYEIYQEIANGPDLKPITKRKYFHTWTRKNGIWKLTTSTFD